MDTFCKIIKGDIPSYTIYEDDLVKCFLDVNPNVNGHTLIVPKKHYTDIYDIDKDTLMHIIEVAKKIDKLYREKLGSKGMSLAQNNGISEEVKHFHLHVLPNYDYKQDLMNVEDVYHQIKD